MSRYIDILVAIILLSLLVTTILLPINYFTTTISDLGLFASSPILHGVIAVSVFLGGAIIMMWWSIKTKSIIGYIYITLLAIFGITQFPIFEWVAFWILCIWTLMRLIKNGKM